MRRKHGFFSYALAEWNADINIRNFWWMFAKVIVNFLLRLCGLRRPSGFSATGTFLTDRHSAVIAHLPLPSLSWTTFSVFTVHIQDWRRHAEPKVRGH